MSNTIAYLTSRADFRQVSSEIPITKQRNPDKFDPPDVFEGAFVAGSVMACPHFVISQSKGNGNRFNRQSKTGGIPDQLLAGARGRRRTSECFLSSDRVRFVLKYLPIVQAKRLQDLEDEMQAANAEYMRAVSRAS